MGKSSVAAGRDHVPGRGIGLERWQTAVEQFGEFGGSHGKSWLVAGSDRCDGTHLALLRAIMIRAARHSSLKDGKLVASEHENEPGELAQLAQVQRHATPRRMFVPWNSIDRIVDCEANSPMGATPMVFRRLGHNRLGLK